MVQIRSAWFAVLPAFGAVHQPLQPLDVQRLLRLLQPARVPRRPVVSGEPVERYICAVGTRSEQEQRVWDQSGRGRAGRATTWSVSKRNGVPGSM